MRAEIGDDVTEEQAREWGYQDVVRQLHDDLDRIGVHFDTWFSERTLHERGDVAACPRRPPRRGARSSATGRRGSARPTTATGATGCSVRSDGPTTYLCNDLAYHRDKFARGWSHLIDIWGADHHGQVKSLQAGFDRARPSRRPRGRCSASSSS